MCLHFCERGHIPKVFANAVEGKGPTRTHGVVGYYSV